MNSKELRKLAEAYQQVYTPQEVDEATAMAKRGYDETKLRKPAGGGEAADRATALEKKPTYGDDKAAKQRSDYARKQRGDFRKTASSSPGLHGYGHKSNDPAVKAKQAARGAQRGALTPAEKKQLNREDFELDQMIESLVERGHTEQEAYALVAQFTLDEAITSEKGKAKAAEMIAKRSTPSGRAKAGQGASVAQIKHISRANVDNLGGTPPNPKIAKNPVKSRSYGGTGNKAARRAAALKKEEFELWVNALVEEGYDLSDYTWDEMYEFYLDEAEKPFPYEKVKAKQVALRDKGGNALDRRMKMGMAVRRAKEAEKTGGSQRDAGKGWYHAKEDYVNESQEARNNPEKYEREQNKKTAPVRGERTPMPPRGDKRREDFEKWYAKQMGR